MTLGKERPPALFLSAAEPQNHAETQEVTLSLEPVPVARCVSAGGRPPARVSWLSPLDGETRESQVSGPVPGTVTVTSRFTLVPLGRADGVKITCRVEHESFKEPVLLPVTLSVRCESTSWFLVGFVSAVPRRGLLCRGWFTMLCQFLPSARRVTRSYRAACPPVWFLSRAHGTALLLVPLTATPLLPRADAAENVVFTRRHLCFARSSAPSRDRYGGWGLAGWGARETAARQCAWWQWSPSLSERLPERPSRRRGPGAVLDMCAFDLRFRSLRVTLRKCRADGAGGRLGVHGGVPGLPGSACQRDAAIGDGR